MKPAWDYKWELPDCNLKPHCGVDALPEALSQLTSDHCYMGLPSSV